MIQKKKMNNKKNSKKKNSKIKSIKLPLNNNNNIINNNIINNNIINNNIINNIKINNNQKNNKNKKENLDMLKPDTDYELNWLSYKDAIKYDKRSNCEYYSALLRSKQLFIFTFCSFNDYNSGIIKRINLSSNL